LREGKGKEGKGDGGVGVDGLWNGYEGKGIEVRESHALISVANLRALSDTNSSFNMPNSCRLFIIILVLRV